MTRSAAVNLAAVALKAAHLPPDPNACAVLALALVGAPGEMSFNDISGVTEKHLRIAGTDLKPITPERHPISALAAALLAAPGITAALAPSAAPPAKAPKPKRSAI